MAAHDFVDLAAGSASSDHRVGQAWTEIGTPIKTGAWSFIAQWRGRQE